jgi:type 1 fimbria pilin
MTKVFPTRRALATLAVFTAAGVAPSARAACTMRNLATYQIGQTTYVDVSNQDRPGDLLREGQGQGEGKLLLTCDEGPVMFRGRWQAGVTTNQIPLTVDGIDAGVAISLFLREQGRGEEHSFPHDFVRNMAAGEEVRSDADGVRYEIRRTTGPVRFGRIDTGRIAQSNVDQKGGGLVVFRSMEIFNLILRRPACTIMAEDLNQVVALPEYNLSNFATVERATPWERFSLRVASCSDPVGLIAQFRFGAEGDAAPGHADWFSLTGPENVALELADKDMRTMAPGMAVQRNALGEGDRYDFHVRLRETRDTVRGGRFRRPIRVEVEYL